MLFSISWHSWNGQNAIKSEKIPLYLKFYKLYHRIPLMFYSKYITFIFYNTKAGSHSQHYKSCVFLFAIYLIKEEWYEHRLDMVFLVQDIIRNCCKYWKINKQIEAEWLLGKKNSLNFLLLFFCSPLMGLHWNY